MTMTTTLDMTSVDSAEGIGRVRGSGVIEAEAEAGGTSGTTGTGTGITIVGRIAAGSGVAAMTDATGDKHTRECVVVVDLSVFLSLCLSVAVCL